MSISSVLSYPERSKKYGDNKYRGNCAGEIVRDLLLHYQPHFFVDPSEGSGTSGDVARELKIPYRGLDLKNGFNLLKDSLLKVLGQRPDYVFYHPAYWQIIKYSGPGGMWGQDSPSHPDDLSNTKTPEEFIEKLQISLINIYDALAQNGFYSVLIGDVRKNGDYYNFQSDVVQIAPGKLQGILIKTQHNCVSDGKQYGGNFIPIAHEFIINFKKDSFIISILDNALQTSKKLVSLSTASWKAIIEYALREMGGKASLDEVYEVVEKTASEKAKSHPHWKAKVRQTCQRHFQNIERGVWGLPQAA